MAGEGKAVYNFDKIEDWANLRARAIDAYDGELPNATTEQLIIDAYEQHPEAVKKAISQVAADFAKGTIRSGWGVTKNRAERILSPPSNPSAKTGIDKERAIARAEAWIKTTGAHFDRQTEILEELFGDRGLLRAYAQIDVIEDGTANGKWKPSEPTGDTALIERMTKLWDQHRPAGIAIEEDTEVRAAKYREHQAQIAELKAQLAAVRKPAPRKPLPEYDYAAVHNDDPPGDLYDQASPDDDIPF